MKSRKVTIPVNALLFICYVLYIGRYPIGWLLAVAPAIPSMLLWALLFISGLVPVFVYQLPRCAVTRRIGQYGDYIMCLFIGILPWALLYDVARLATRLAGSLYAGFWERNRVQAGAVFCLGAICVTAYGVYNVLKRPRITPFHIRIGKKSGLDKLRVALIADLHLGFVYGTRKLNQIVRQINSQNPDLVVIAGDMFNENMREVYHNVELAEAFRRIESRFGVYMCLGNHDSGKDYPQMLEFIGQTGIRLLRDEAEEIAGAFVLAGRTDPFASKKYNMDPSMPLRQVLSGTDAEKPLLLLDHQPTRYDEAEECKVDLVLSGHTHTGQVFPFSLVTKRYFVNDRGYYAQGALQTVVCTGTNTASPPIRLGTHSEIVLIDINFEAVEAGA